MALWQAKQICPEIIFVPPRMDLYLRFSQMARAVSYTHLDVYKRQLLKRMLTSGKTRKYCALRQWGLLVVMVRDARQEC